MARKLKDIVKYNSIDSEGFLDVFNFGNNVTYTYDDSNKTYSFRGNFGKHILAGVLTYMNRKKSDKLFRLINSDTIIIDSLFLLELVSLVDLIIDNDKIWYKINKKSLSNLLTILKNDTWLRAMYHPDEPDVFKLNMNALAEKMNVQPLPYQLPVYKAYEDIKNKLGYNGILLDVATGTGKTYLGLSLSEIVDAEVVVVVAMKNILDTVWTRTLVNDSEPSKYFFKQKITWSTIYTARDLNRPYNNEKYIILNYEALEKIDLFVNNIIGKKVSIIGDEIHNFTGLNSKRKDNLIRLCKLTKSKDIILMSGTPIKKSPLELIPYLTMIDPKATNTALSRYRDIYSSPSEFFKSIIPIRYGSISVKIEKAELNLDPVEYSTVLVKVKDGERFTLAAIKEDMKVYTENRKKELSIKEDVNRKRFIELLNLALVNNKSLTRANIDKYIEDHTRLRKVADNNQLMFNIDLLKSVTHFEKTNLIPYLYGLDKSDFKDVTVSLKYPMLKIRGEVLGKVVLRARIDAHTEMAKEMDYSIMDGTLGKTLLLSNYVEVCEAAVAKMNKQKYNPLKAYGVYTKQISSTVTRFMDDPTVDSMIGTIGSIGTGHPLTAASMTIVFDLPFRTYLLDQLVARTWRQGQTRQVKVVYTTLDTGGEYNINSRNIDILKWAKDAVEEITGNKIYGLDFDKGKTIELDVATDIDLETFLNATNEEDLIMKKRLKDRIDLEDIKPVEVDTSILIPNDVSYGRVCKESFDANSNYMYTNMKLNNIATLINEPSDTEVMVESDDIVDSELFGFSKKDYFYTKLTETKLHKFVRVKGPEGLFSTVNAWYNMDKWLHGITKDELKDAKAYLDKVKSNVTAGLKELPKYRKLKKADYDSFIGDPKELKEWLEGFDEAYAENLKEIEDEFIEKQSSPSKAELTKFNKEHYDVFTSLVKDLAKGIVPYKDGLDIESMDNDNIDSEGILDWFKSKDNKAIPAVTMTSGAIGLFNYGIEDVFIEEHINDLTEEDEEITLDLNVMSDYNKYLSNIIKYGSTKEYTIYTDGSIYDGKDKVAEDVDMPNTSNALDYAKVVGDKNIYDYAGNPKKDMAEALLAMSKDTKNTLGSNIFGFVLKAIDAGLKTYKDSAQKKALNDLKNTVNMAIRYIDSNTKVIKESDIDKEEYDLTPTVNTIATADIGCPIIAEDITMDIPIKTVSHLAEVADLEAFDTFRGLVMTGANKVSSALSRVKALFKTNDIAHTDDIDARFQDIANILIGVPAGLTGKLKDISSFISKYSSHVLVLSNDLDVAIEALSSYLNNATARESAIIDNTISRAIANNAKELYELNGKYLTPSRVDARTIGSLLYSINDIRDISKDLKDSRLYLTVANLNDIQDKINMIDDIIKNIINDKKDFSAVKIKEISLLIDNLISYTNGVGTLIYLKNSLDIILIDIEAVIKTK